MSCTVIAPIEHISPSIFLTSQELSEFGLHDGDFVTVVSGSSSVNATVNNSHQGNYVSLELIKALGLPKFSSLKMKSIDSAKLQIGPLIGIMISRGKKYRLPPYTSQGPLLRSFLKYGINANTMTFVFSPGDVDTLNEKVTGHFLGIGPDGKHQWQTHTFPLPDIVYDRILFRTFERKKSTREITAFFLNHSDIQYFNPKFLNKWETYLILRKNPRLQNHIPETKKYENPENLVTFLKTYNTVYLKPANGSLGKGIIRVSLTAGGYQFQYRNGKKTVTGIWSMNELSMGLKENIKNKTYIMQQGLDFLKLAGKVFDIRVLLQKDESGSWINSATVARVAPEGNIFPNVAAGGYPKNMEALWQELTAGDWLSSASRKETMDVCLEAAESLEAALGTFGEIGLDIGIDVNGMPWIIEINSKPSRKVFPADQMHLKKMSLKLPIDFASHLAGFTESQGRVDR